MVNDKQFILAEDVYEMEGWENLQLSSGYILSYHSDLNIVFNKMKNAVLLGYAWQTDPDQMSPNEIVKNWRGG